MLFISREMFLNCFQNKIHPSYVGVKCQVCSGQAVGFHYGADVCAGCRVSIMTIVVKILQGKYLKVHPDPLNVAREGCISHWIALLGCKSLKHTEILETYLKQI